MTAPHFIDARIIAHTRFSRRSSLVTAVILLPRCLLAEANTHRLPSRNAGSTRAIPTNDMIAAMRARTYVPWHWKANKKGMSGGEYLPDSVVAECVERWCADAEHAVESARFFAARNVIKGIRNRPLDLFSYVEWLVTFRVETLPHFFNLRNDSGTEDQLRDIVDNFERVFNESAPTESDVHAPFVSDAEKAAHPLREVLLVSTARNRRVSVMRLEDKTRPSWNEDVDKATEMMSTRPLHASPYEHPCYVPRGRWRTRFAAGNLAMPDEWLCDFVQFRKAIPDEFMRRRIMNGSGT